VALRARINSIRNIADALLIRDIADSSVKCALEFVLFLFLTWFQHRPISLPESSGKEGTVSLAKPHCRNSSQRLQKEALAISFSGSFMFNPWALRPKRPEGHNFLSGKHLNGTRFCAREHSLASRLRGLKQPCVLGLCKSDHVAKIAASPRVRTQNTHHCRAFAQSSSQQRCIRAEARRGYFPPLYLQHQTGPP
jgi:hypothetical protein